MAQILARNTDAILISKNLKLGNKNYDVNHQFHHTFWYGQCNGINKAIYTNIEYYPRIGDLNYRINMTKDEVVKYVEAKDYDSLYKEDQFRYD